MIEEKLYQLCRQLQRNNKFLVDDLGTGLTPSESFALLTVSRIPGCTISTITEQLGLEQSSTSRLVQRLVHRKLLSCVGNKKNSRMKQVTLSAAGRAWVSHYDDLSNRNIKIFTRDMNADEVLNVTAIFKAIGDSQRAPEIPLVGSDVPIRREMRRATRGLNFFSKKFLESQLSMVEWQFLSAVDELSGAATVSKIAELLSLDQPQTSVVLATLSRRGFIIKKKDRVDQRLTKLTISNRGTTVLVDLSDKYKHRLQQALTFIAATEQAAAVKAFERFVTNGERSISLLSNGMYIQRAESKDDRSLLRTLAGQLLFTHYTVDQLPEVLFYQNAISYGIYVDNELIGALELLPHNDSFIVKNYLISTNISLPLEKLLTEIAPILLIDRSRITIDVPYL